MSKRQEFHDIEEQKRLLVAKADLQRSTFLMVASPVFKMFQTAEVGIFAVRVGRTIAQHMRH